MMSSDLSTPSGMTFTRIDHGRLVRMDRTLNYNDYNDDPGHPDATALHPATEVTGPYWALAVGRVNGIAAAWDGQQLRHAPPHLIAFLPPFSIVAWRFQGSIALRSVFGNMPLPPDLAGLPPFFAEAPADTAPESLADVCTLLATIATTGKYQNIDRAPAPSGIARRVKEIIDQSYAAPKSFAQIARDLNTSNAVLTRIFKKTYGISPIEYRSHLRIAASLNHLVIDGTTVGNAVENVGFSDLKRFHSHFKREMGAIPSRFRLPLTPSS